MSVNTTYNNDILVPKSKYSFVQFFMLWKPHACKLYAYLVYMLLSFTCSLSVLCMLTSRFECNVPFQRIDTCYACWDYNGKRILIWMNVSSIWHYLFIKSIIWVTSNCDVRQIYTTLYTFINLNNLIFSLLSLSLSLSICFFRSRIQRFPEHFF